MQDALNTINNFINSVPPAVWEVGLTALVISPLLEVVKRVRKIDKGRTMFWLVTISSFIPVVFNYVQTAAPNNPWVIVGQTFIVGFSTQPVYHLLVKPLLGAWTKVSAESAAQYASDAQSAVVPTEGLPITAAPLGPVDAPTPMGISVSTTDFSN